MKKTLVTVEDEHGFVQPYKDMRVCCDHNSNFSYEYLIHCKLPRKYKGYYIERINIINK